MTKAMKTMAMARLAMAMAMAMARLKLTPDLNVNNGYDGRAVKVAMRVLREEIEAFLGKSTSVNSAIKMRGERHSRSRRRRRRRRGGRMDVTKLCRKPRSASGLGIVHNVTQNPRGLVLALRLETGVQQVLRAMAVRAVTRSSRMGRALAWNGAGGPPQVDQACAGGIGREGIAELQGRRLGHRRRGRVDMGCGVGGGGGVGSGGGGVGKASGAAPAVEPWQQQQRVKTTCYLRKGFLRWECSGWSSLWGW